MKELGTSEKNDIVIFGQETRRSNASLKNIHIAFQLF